MQKIVAADVEVWKYEMIFYKLKDFYKRNANLPAIILNVRIKAALFAYL